MYGLGLGLWWGEENKANKSALRIGNTDPDLLRVFLTYLDDIFQIDRSRLRFGLQLFSDIDAVTAKRFWCRELSVSPKQFQTIVVTKSVSQGTYSKKSRYGVLTIYFSNTKIRASIYRAIEALRKNSYANVAQLVERIHGGSH